MPCPCGGASVPHRKRPVKAKAPDYADCCGRFIEAGGVPAGSAMELMRSRYTAYVLRNTEYLRKTWATQTCPSDLDVSSDQNMQWLGLEIKRHDVADETHAEVEFVAIYKMGGRAHRLHESSRFERDEASHWRYIDGHIHDA